ncbi:hypothetical protein EFM01_13625, partial [Lactococcus lactis]|nr:hypothetical protein [Lactococcus lactis]
ADGTQGTPGKPGADGKTPYFHTAWSYSSDGTDGFTTTYPNLNLLDGSGHHTVTGTNTQGYLSDETTNDFLTLFKGLEGQTVTVSVDYEYSGFIAGGGANRLGWEAQIVTDTNSWFGPWYYPTNDSGSGRMSATFVVPKNIINIVYSEAYIQFSGSGTGTLSHLKIEKGSVDTPHMPSSSEVTTADWPSYIGQYTDFTQADSTNPSDYTWSRIRGNDGKDGANGKD